MSPGSASAAAISSEVSTCRPSPPDRSRRRSIVSQSADTSSATEPPGHQLGKIGATQRFETEQRRSAAQRRVDLEERVLGGRPDEHERAVLHSRQERILLGLGEPVDLVEEEDRALPPLTEPLSRPGDDVTHVLHPGGHRRELLEGTSRAAGDSEGERGLAGARRPPQQHRRQTIELDQPSVAVGRDRRGGPGRRCRRSSAAAACAASGAWPRSFSSAATLKRSSLTRTPGRSRRGGSRRRGRRARRHRPTSMPRTRLRQGWARRRAARSGTRTSDAPAPAEVPGLVDPVGVLVHHPLRMLPDQGHVVGPEPRFLAEFAPGGVDRLLPTAQPTLRELPGVGDITPSSNAITAPSSRVMAITTPARKCCPGTLSTLARVVDHRPRASRRLRTSAESASVAATIPK